MGNRCAKSPKTRNLKVRFMKTNKASGSQAFVSMLEDGLSGSGKVDLKTHTLSMSVDGVMRVVPLNVSGGSHSTVQTSGTSSTSKAAAASTSSAAAPKNPISSPAVIATIDSPKEWAAHFSASAGTGAPKKLATFSCFKFKMPKFKVFRRKNRQQDTAHSEAKPKADLHLPYESLSGDIDASAPSADVDISSELDGLSADLKVSGPDAKLADVDVDLKGLNVDIRVPDVKFGRSLVRPHVNTCVPDAEVISNVPEAEAHIKAPDDVDANMPKAKDKSGFGIEPPAVKFPNLKNSASINATSEGAELDLSGKYNLPTGDVDANFGIAVPGADFSGEGLDIDLELQYKSKRDFGFSLPKCGGNAKLEGDANINGPNVKDPVTNLETDVKLPIGNIDVDIDPPSAKLLNDTILDLSGAVPKPKDGDFSLKVPKIRFPRLKSCRKDSGGVDADLNLSGALEFSISKPSVARAPSPDRRSSGGVKIGGPSLGLNGDFPPAVNVDLPKLGADVGTLSLDITRPLSDIVASSVDIEMPSAGVNTQSVVIGTSGIDINTTTFGIDGPLHDEKTISVYPNPPPMNVSVASVDINTSAISGTHVKSPSMCINAKATVHVNLNSGAEAGVSIPSKETGELKSKSLSSPSCSSSSSSFGRSSSISSDSNSLQKSSDQLADVNDLNATVKSNMDTDKPSTEVKNDAKVDLPQGDADATTPSIDVDISGELDGLSANVEMPGHDVEQGGDADADVKCKKRLGINLPDRSLPEYEGVGKAGADLSGRSVDMKIPYMNVGGSVASVPDADVVFNVPEAEASIKASDDVEANMPKAKGKSGFGIELLTVEFRNLKSSTSINATSGGAEFDADLSGHSNLPTGSLDVGQPDVGVSANLSSADVEIGAPEVDIGAELLSDDVDANMAIAVPLANFSGEGPDVDLDHQYKSKGDFSFSLPKCGGKTRLEEDTNIDGSNVKDPLANLDTNVKLLFGKVVVDIDPPSDDTVLDLSGVLPKPKGKDISPKAPNFEFPRPNNQGKNSGGVDADLNLSGGLGFSISKPSVRVPLPDLELSGDVKSREPSLGLNEEIPPAVKVDLPKLGVDVEVPSLDINKPLSGIDASSVDIEMPSADANLPSMDVKVTSEDINTITVSGVHVKSPSMCIDDKPIVDVNLNSDGGAGSSLPSNGIGKSRTLNSLSCSSSSSNSSQSSSISSDSNRSQKSADVNDLSATVKTNMDTDKPSAEVKNDAKVDLPQGDADATAPSIDVDIRSEIDWFSANLEITKPDVELGGDADADVKNMKGLAINPPDRILPEFEDVGKVDADLSSQSLGMEFPDMNVGESSIGPSVDPSAPDDDVVFNMPEAEANIKASDDVDANTSKAKGRLGYSIREPSVKVRLPDLELSGHVKISGLSLGLNEEIPLTLSVDLSKLCVDVEVPSLEINKPLTNIDASSVDIETPSADANLPSMDVNITSEDINIITISGVHVKSSSMCIDDKATVDVHLNSGAGAYFSLPSNGIGESKSRSLNSRSYSSSSSCSSQNNSISSDSYKSRKSADVNGLYAMVKSNINTDKPSAEVKDTTKVDLPQGNADATAPSTDLDISSELDGFSANLEISGPDVELGGDANVDEDGKKGLAIKLPELSLPKFGGVWKDDADLSSRSVDMEVPDLNVGGSIVGPSVDASAPDAKDIFNVLEVEANIKASDDVDANVPTGKGGFGIELSTVKLPNLKSSTSINAPSGGAELDAVLSGFSNLPTGSLDVGQPDVDVSANLSSADVEVGTPEVDIGAELLPGDVDANVGIAVPDANFSVKGPDIDLSLKYKSNGNFGFSLSNFGGKAKLEGDANIDGPNVKDSLTNLDTNVKLLFGNVDVDIDPPSAKFSDDTVPKLEYCSPKGSGKDSGGVGADVNLSGHGTNFDGPKVVVNDLMGNVPKGDLDILHINGHGGVDVSLSSGSANVDLHKGAIDLKATKVDQNASVTIPECNLEFDVKGKVNFNKYKIKMPRSKRSTDVSMNGPNGDLANPEAGSINSFGNGDAKGPTFSAVVNRPMCSDADASFVPLSDCDIDFSTPESGRSWSDTEGQNTVKFPACGAMEVVQPGAGAELEAALPIKCSKLFGEINGVINGDMGVSPLSGNAGNNLKVPDQSTSMKGKGELDVDVSVQAIDVKAEGGLDVLVLSVDIDTPALSGDVDLPSVNVREPAVDIDVPEVSGDVNIPGVKMQGPSINSDNSNVKGKDDFGFKLPKAKFPNLEGVTKLPSDDVNLDTEVNITSHQVDLPQTGIETSADLSSKDTELPQVESAVDASLLSGLDANASVHSISTEDKDMEHKTRFSPNPLDFHQSKLGGEGKGKSPAISADVDFKGPIVNADAITPTIAGTFEPGEATAGIQGPEVNISGNGANFSVTSDADLNLLPGVDFHPKGGFDLFMVEGTIDLRPSSMHIGLDTDISPSDTLNRSVDVMSHCSLQTPGIVPTECYQQCDLNDLPSADISLSPDEKTQSAKPDSSVRGLIEFKLPSFGRKPSKSSGSSDKDLKISADIKALSGELESSSNIANTRFSAPSTGLSCMAGSLDSGTDVGADGGVCGSSPQVETAAEIDAGTPSFSVGSSIAAVGDISLSGDVDKKND